MTTYYVSVAGNNDHDGKSTSTAWASIQKGLNKLQAGDTLEIMAGTYSPGDDELSNRDYWQLKEKHGTAANYITIKANSASVKLSGQESGSKGGYPQRDLQNWELNGVPQAYVYQGVMYWSTLIPLFWIVDCSYITLGDSSNPQSLQVVNSLGQGVEIKGTKQNIFADYYEGHASEGAKPALCHHINVYMKVHNTRHRNLRILNCWDVTIANGEYSFGNWAKWRGSGGPAVQNSYYVNFTNNVVHHHDGEGFVADMNNYNSRNIYITNNIFFDCKRAAIYCHALDYFIVSGNLIYQTAQDKAVPISSKSFWGAGKGIAVNAREQQRNRSNQKGTSYGLVSANIVVDRNDGINVKSELPDNFPTEQPVKYIYVVGNTVINSADVNYGWATNTAASCVFKGNISVHTDAKKHISTNNRGNISGVTADYNVYNQTLSGEPSNLTGVNDQENTDPQLAGDDAAPEKKVPTSQSNQYGWYLPIDSQTGQVTHKYGYNDATKFRILGASACVGGGATVTAPAGWDGDEGWTDGDDMSDWIDAAFDFGVVPPNARTNPARVVTWDVGAHEYATEGTDKPTATSGVSGTQTVGTSLSFTGSGAGGTGPYTYHWDFGDGTATTTTQNPSHAYGAAGYYEAVLTVTDANGLTGTDTETLDITQGGTDAGEVGIEQVEFDAGSATYTVTHQPKAIFWASTGATDATEDEAVDNAALRFGIWDSAGNQYATSYYGKHDQGTTVTRSSNVSGAMHHFLQDEANTTQTVTISSATATTVTMGTWPTQENGEAILSYNFYGAGITNVKATSVSLGSADSTVTVSGNFNYLIMPVSLKAGMGDQFTLGAISLGMADRNGNTVCHAIRNRNGQSTTMIYAQTATDRVAYLPYANTWVEIDTWDASGITFIVKNGDIDREAPALLMYIDADIDIGVLDIPTSTGNSDTTVGFDAGVAWVWGGLLAATGTTVATDDSAEAFNFTSVSVADVDYSLAIASADAVAKSDESSHYSGAGTNNWVWIKGDGTADANGTMSLETNVLRINVNDAAASTYKAPYCAIKAVSGSTALDAEFIYYKAGTNPADEIPIKAGDSVQFREISSTTGTTDTWVWVWGDGTANGTTKQPTHTFATAGTYTVTLTVDDDTIEQDTQSYDVTVGRPDPVSTFDPSTDITGASGAAPLAVTIDTSNISAGSGEVLDYVNVRINNSLTKQVVWGASVNSGDVPGTTLLRPGNYDLEIDVGYKSEPFWTYPVVQIADAFVATVTDTKTAKITGLYGPYRVPQVAGGSTWDETFGVEVGGELITEAGKYDSVSWTFGDGETSSVWQPTNNYAAVGSATSYDVSVTVTGNDGTEYTDTITNYVTLYPVQTAPPSLAVLTTRLTNLLAVDYLDGTWTVEGAPNTNVYSHTEAMPWATATTVRVIEDGTELTSRASVALCQANPGSYYVASVGPLVVYVHPTNSDNPNTNGSEYRWLYA